MRSTSANDKYLQSTVFTASPARLRFMLLERAVSLVEIIQEERTRNPESLVNERTITLRDILGELLNGVGKAQDQLAQQVADIYVFMIQELTFAECEPGLDRIKSIGMILEIELETWRQVCDAQVKRVVPAPAMSSFPTKDSVSGGTYVSGSLNFTA